MMNMNESSLGNPQYMGAKGFTYSYSIEMTFKGRQLLYMKIITTMSTLDMSNNKFEGGIPNSIGKLHSLRGLNLSHNLLTGSIPPSIGMLSLLDCLDLSSNRLIGHIPQELTSLTFLEVFNVSMNLLKGPIPHGNNFNTFSADSYKDNLGLCGQPLLECGASRVPSMNNTGDDDEDLSNDDGNTLSMWEIVMMGFGSGVVVGLAWGYYMLSVGKPFWFIKLSYKMELALLGFWDQQFG
uniref:Uncharacterized protein n=2 Tax=Chenopodium quinoa TaxID=63459 RepID=A0A803LQ60_CHEQI